MSTAVLDGEDVMTDETPSDAIVEAINTPAASGPTIEAATEKLEKNSVCLQLELSAWGNHRKADISKIETDADKALLGMEKQLINAQELENLYSLQRDLRNWVVRKTLPSFFKRGVYLLPGRLVTLVDKKIQETKEQLPEMLDAFLAVYPDKIEEARERLASQFSETDYPDPEVLRAKFAIKHKYLQFQMAPGNLKEFNLELYRQQQAKYEQMWGEVLDSAKMFLRAEMSDMVNRLVERLTPDADGKPKTFQYTTVEAFKEFLDYFDARNITDDGELADVVRRARRIMDGVSVKDLRDKEGSMKEIVAGGLAQVKQALDRPGFVQKVNRVYNFDDE